MNVVLLGFLWTANERVGGAAIATGFSEAWRRCPGMHWPLGRWLRRLFERGETQLDSAGTQPNEGYP